MNLIDRDKLILYLNDWAYAIAPDYVRESNLVEEVIRRIKYETIMEVIDEINKVPKVNQWIPCKERLPEENTNVNITNCYGVVRTGYWFEEEGNKYWYCERDLFVEDYVIAWQPLPKPYKEKENVD